jgi:hypothetical protein
MAQLKLINNERTSAYNARLAAVMIVNSKTLHQCIWAMDEYVELYGKDTKEAELAIVGTIDINSLPSSY